MLIIQSLVHFLLANLYPISMDIIPQQNDCKLYRYASIDMFMILRNFRLFLYVHGSVQFY